MTDIPFISINDEVIENVDDIKKGDMIKCPHCGGSHVAKVAKVVEELTGDSDFLYYKCDKTGISYMCGGKGKTMFGAEVIRNKIK